MIGLEIVNQKLYKSGEEREAAIKACLERFKWCDQLFWQEILETLDIVHMPSGHDD